MLFFQTHWWLFWGDIFINPLFCHFTKWKNSCFHVKPCIHCAIFVLLRSVPTGNRIDKWISDILVTSHEVNKQLKQCYEPTALNTNETLVTWCDVWKDTWRLHSSGFGGSHVFTSYVYCEQSSFISTLDCIEWAQIHCMQFTCTVRVGI